MKILFVGALDSYFCWHRLALLRASRNLGAEVVVMTRWTGFENTLEGEGFRVIPWHVSRGSLNPYREFRAFLEVLRTYRRERPDLVHHFALKPILYGGLAARLCGDIPSVNSFTGLGHVFTSPRWPMRFLRLQLVGVLRFVLKNRNALNVFFNAADRETLVDAARIPGDRARVLRGAGVNLRDFFPRPEPGGIPVVMLPGRMLWEKGVGDFVAAAKSLRAHDVSARFVLVGAPDPDRPRASVPAAQLRAWAQEGIVEWWGHQHDMPAVLGQANVVCLPSHGEGLPNVLLEAAACGRAIVASDIPGCREIVHPGVNGLVTPVRDPDALASALQALLKDPDLRSRMGAQGREIAARDFSEDLVAQETLAAYRKLLSRNSHVPSK